MDYKEFNVKTRKADQPRKTTIKGSFGVYDCYKKIRKNQWYDIGRPLKEHEFYSIIRGVNKLIAEGLANGEEFIFPSRMGKLELRRNHEGVSIVNGKLINTHPIDWAGTLKLWYEDEEAKNNKSLVRIIREPSFHIKYNKFAANYENQSFYEFTLNRFIKIALAENVKQGKIDTLW